MKTLIICESVHHGNTKKVADAIADTLKAEVKKPSDVDATTLGEYGLIGFGSGIYHGKMHDNLLKLADSLPKLDTPVFVFSTAGNIFAVTLKTMRGHRPLKAQLAEKGYRVIGEFTCLGYDTYVAKWPFGGINKGRPNEADLENARQFARKLNAMGRLS